MQPDPFDLETISVEEIATLAGVSNPAVSNWARRDPDFPKSVRTEGRRVLYPMAAVTAWLARRGVDALIGLSDFERRFWQVADRSRHLLDGTTLLEALAWLSALQRSTSTTAATPIEAVAAAAASLGDEAAEGIGVVTNFDAATYELLRELAIDVAAADGKPLEAILSTSIRRERRGEYTDNPALIKDMLALCDLRQGLHLLDLQAGFGSVLRLASRQNTNLTAKGRVQSEAQRRMTTAFCAAMGVTVNLAVVAPWPAPADEHTCDRVIGVLPYGQTFDFDDDDPRWTYGVPTPGALLWAWIQESLYHLRPGGRAVLAVLPAMTGPSLRGNIAQIDAMLQDGVILAAVKTRHQLFGTSIPATLIVLGEPTTRPDDTSVLMVDLTIDTDQPDRFADWAQGRHDDKDPRCRLVSRVELIANEFALDPRRYVVPPADVIDPRLLAGSLAQATADAAALFGQLHQLTPTITSPHFNPDLGVWHRLTLEQLSHASAVEVIVSGARTARDDSGEIPVLSVGYLREPDGTPRVFADRADNPKAAALVGGDLILCLDHRPGHTYGVTTAEDGWLLGSGLVCLRFADTYPGLHDGWISLWLRQTPFRRECERLSGGTSIQRLARRDLLKIPIPLPPIEVQRAAVEHQALLDQMAQLNREAQRYVEQIAAVSNQLLEWRLQNEGDIADPARPATKMAAAPPAALDGLAVTLRRKGVEARAEYRGDNFVVLMGSSARSDATASLSPSYVQLRQSLLMQRVLLPRGDQLTAQTDIPFDSPTAAASVLLGTNVNGLAVWTLDDGRPLKVIAPRRGQR